MKTNNSSNFAPVITLMVLAPLITEVLPGATRFSSLFVFPIEMCVWGGGAVLIRHAVRKWRLGWLGMLFLALGLSLAEEFLIQQSSLAPMVLKLKGVTYARAFGINYVYLLWALIYEPVMVVFLPIYLVELIFPGRRKGQWLGKTGLVFMCFLFLAGSFMAWYSWTQIARPKVFHVPAYNPPLAIIVVAVVLIAHLAFLAIGLFRNKAGQKTTSINPLPTWLTGLLGGLWAVLLYGIVVLAFGDAPTFPPLVAMAGGLLLAAVPLYFVPRWAGSPHWQPMQRFSLISGTILGSMLVGFIGFIGAAPMDLYFKIAINILAAAFLVVVGLRVNKTHIEEDNFMGARHGGHPSKIIL